MGGEEAAAAVDVMNRLDDRPGDGEPVIGGGAAPDLVEDHEAALGRLRQDRGGLDHLDHEGRSPAREIVRRADPAEQRSTRPSLADVAGTKLPAWARIAIKAFWRRKVDLPPMLGPVTSHSRLSAKGRRSLATKRPPAAATAASTTGWRPPSISKQGCGAKAGGTSRLRRALGQRGATSSRASASAVAAMSDARASAARGQLFQMRGLGGQRVRACLPTRIACSWRSAALKRTPGQRLAVGEARILRHQRIGVPGRHLDMIAEHAIVRT
jgi:hypothetical protein